MARTTYQELLDAGVHFGHLTRKWDPKMAKYIFMERNGIHIIDLNKTLTKLEEAASAIKQVVKSGRKILFVATKKQAKDIISAQAKAVNMPYVTERWLGGMLTNFATVRKSIKKMSNIDKMTKDGTYDVLSKKEKLMIQRERIKLESLLGGIADLNRLPAALFIIDVKKEHIAVSEALKLNIPTFAMVDTNSDPTNIDFPIPSNDDATKSITLISELIGKAIQEGLEERKRDKEEEAEKEAAAAKAKIDTGEEPEATVEEKEAKADTETSGKRPRKAKAEATAESEEAKDGE
ncbi:30S ribosomal protein S2 [Parapedobacter tibetensis]|uniref:30S ribosomal protein S2 n=1 Tax=Parapedobacter tibetensis TaxID=2972951 RepID=UPI00214D83BD|nr:30S ribosomal protein S2 [Parapedobacter tibetensis]